MDIKRIGTLLVRGIAPEFAPEILRGVLVALVRKKNLNVVELTKWVQENRSLWLSLETRHQEMIRKMAQNLGNVNWINSDWAINALRDDYPAVASLFLGWKKSRNWLDRQLNEIKIQVR